MKKNLGKVTVVVVLAAFLLTGCKLVDKFIPEVVALLDLATGDAGSGQDCTPTPIPDGDGGLTDSEGGYINIAGDADTSETDAANAGTRADTAGADASEAGTTGTDANAAADTDTSGTDAAGTDVNTSETDTGDTDTGETTGTDTEGAEAGAGNQPETDIAYTPQNYKTRLHTDNADYFVEYNNDDRTDIYPYIVRTGYANWYIATADIKQMGEYAIVAGLTGLLQYQEGDFAEAREALTGYIDATIEPIDIYTDFANEEYACSGIGASYNVMRNVIRVYGGWDAVKCSLLHEYVHYLTMHCTDTPASMDLFKEGLTEYIATGLCANNMARSVNYGISQEAADNYSALGAWNEETDSLDYYRVNLIEAEFMTDGSRENQMLLTVRGVNERRKAVAGAYPDSGEVSYPEACSLMEYLKVRFGLDYVLANMSCTEDKFSSVFGCSFGKLYGLWRYWNLNECRELGLGVNDSGIYTKSIIPNEIYDAAARIEMEEFIIPGNTGKLPGRSYTYYDGDGKIIYENHDDGFGLCTGRLYSPYSPIEHNYEVEFPDDERYTYSYDAEGRVLSMHYDGEVGVYSEYTYYDNGLLHTHMSENFPNKDLYTYYYDEQNRIVKEEHELIPGPDAGERHFVEIITYTYYDNGLKYTECHDTFTQKELRTSFYDEEGRLISETTDITPVGGGQYRTEVMTCTYGSDGVQTILVTTAEDNVLMKMRKSCEYITRATEDTQNAEITEE